MKKRIFLTLLSLCVVCFGAKAQVIAYNFSAFPGSFTPITGGTVIGTGIPDSYTSPSITLTPGFVFSGVTYTNAYFTSNGLITLGGATAPSNTEYNGVANNTGSGIAICPFNADMVGSTITGANPNMRFETIGNEHVFQWQDISRWTSATDRMSIQARFNTVTGQITFVYDLVSAGTSTSYQPVVGIRTSATDYRSLLITSGGTETWAAPLTSTATSNQLRFTTTSPAKVFASGQTYVWTPPTCPPPKNITTALTFSTAAMTWTNGGTEAAWIFSYDPPTTTLTVATPSYMVNNLQPSTSYTLRVRAFCGVGDTSIWVTNTITTPCHAPDLTSVSAASLCVTGTVNIQATTASSASVRWYTVGVGGAVTSTNTIYNTPTLTNTTTYYVSARNGTSNNTGRLAPAAPFGSGNSAYSGGLYFNATSAFVLQSVDVYCVGAAATGVINLLNSAGTIVQSATVNFPAGTIASPVLFTIPLNWSIAIGNDWVIYREPGGGTVTLGGPETGVTPAGTSIPLVSGSQVGAITRGYWFGVVNDYYFFYNWVIGAGCESVRTPVTVTVFPKPTVLALSSATGAICAGTPANLLCAGNATSFTWTPAGGSASLATVYPNLNTTYTVAAELAPHCAITKTVAVAVNPQPLVTINTDNTTLCSGETVSLTASGNAVNYVWYPDGGIANVANVSPSVTTVYVATGYDNLGCAGTSSIQLDVNPSPVLDVVASKTLACQKENVTLTASTDATSYIWSTGSTALSTVVAPQSTTTYSVSATNGICTTIAYITVTTDACTAIEKQEAAAGINLYPNPVNDALMVTMPSGNNTTSIMIFDVVGKLVVSQTLSQELNSVNVNSLEKGAYFFKVMSNDNTVKTGKIIKN